MRVVKQFLAVVAVSVVGSRAVVAAQDNAVLSLILGVATAAAAIIVYGWVVRRTERREVTELARDGAAARLNRGVLIGVAMFAAVIAAIALMGGYHVHGLGSVSGAVGLVGFMAAAAVTEELMFRGLLFRPVEERPGGRGADAARAGGSAADRRRAVEQRDRGKVGEQSGDGEDVRVADPDEAGPAGPGAGGGVRVPHRPGHLSIGFVVAFSTHRLGCRLRPRR